MQRVNVASAIIYNDIGQLLIVKNRVGDAYYWTIPGGAVEEGETLEQAVVREVKEETGFTVAVTGFSSLREKFFLKRQHHTLFATFFARVIEGEILIDDPDKEIVEVKWVNRREAQELMPFLFEAIRLDSDLNRAAAFYAFEGMHDS